MSDAWPSQSHSWLYAGTDTLMIGIVVEKLLSPLERLHVIPPGKMDVCALALDICNHVGGGRIGHERRASHADRAGCTRCSDGSISARCDDQMRRGTFALLDVLNEVRKSPVFE